jgi:hypothetical protein
LHGVGGDIVFGVDASDDETGGEKSNTTRTYAMLDKVESGG